MADIENSLIERLMQKDSISVVRRFAIGALLAASIPFGSQFIIATGLVSVAINTAVFYFEKKSDEKKLLAFYKDDIATLRDKPADSVTATDLDMVGLSRAEGGNGVGTIANELKDFDRHQKMRMLGSTLSSAITVGALVAIHIIFPQFLVDGFSMVLGLGLIGLGHNIVAKTVKAINEMTFGSHEIDNTVNQRLIRMAEDIKLKPANAIELFSLFVDAKPSLQNDIEKRYGAKYADLPILLKKQVVESYEPQLRTIALTDEINKGAIKPSLVGFIICDQLSDALPGAKQYKALFTRPAATVSAQDTSPHCQQQGLSYYRDRLITERETKSPSKSLH